MANNVSHIVRDDKLIITVDLKQQGTPSRAGKVMLVGSAAWVPIAYGDRAGLTYSINVMAPR